jgi:hypothetical protein
LRVEFLEVVNQSARWPIKVCFTPINALIGPSYG